MRRITNSMLKKKNNKKDYKEQVQVIKRKKYNKNDQSHQLLGRIKRRTDISYFIIISSPLDI